MDTFKIYEAGKMGGLSPAYAREARDKFIDEIHNQLLFKDILTKVDVCNPCDYYNFDPNDTEFPHDSERETRQYDLWRVRNSNLIVVFFLGNGKSQGTTAELTLAHELHIPIIGIDLITDDVEIHPWDKCVVDKMFYGLDSMPDMAKYIIQFYLY